MPSEYAKGLRELADFVELHPEFGEPYQYEFNLFGEGKDALSKFVGASGTVKKDTDDNFFFVTKKFSGKVRLNFNVRHENICEKVEIGRKIVPAHEEMIVPAQPEHEEIQYAWKCPHILGEES
jgi:hypothetical protein